MPTLQEQLKELKAENSHLKAQLSSGDNKTMEEKIEEAAFLAAMSSVYSRGITYSGPSLKALIQSAVENAIEGATYGVAAYREFIQRKENILAPTPDPVKELLQGKSEDEDEDED